MGKIGQHLFFKLWPIPSGNHRHLHNPQQSTEPCGHLGIERCFAFGKRAIQIENNESFHELGALRK